jgi:hypothetical protein
LLVVRHLSKNEGKRTYEKEGNVGEEERESKNERAKILVINNGTRKDRIKIDCAMFGWWCG